jgi:hypothetical protein
VSGHGKELNRELRIEKRERASVTNFILSHNYPLPTGSYDSFFSALTIYVLTFTGGKTELNISYGNKRI